MTKLSDQEAQRRLEALDPAADGVRDGASIRALSEAVDRRSADQREIEALVGDARGSGATWIEIGLALGVSPQAARQRYRESTLQAVNPAPTAFTSSDRVFEIYRTPSGSYRWRLKAAGDVVATSADFATKADAHASIQALKQGLSGTPIDDLASA
jgi:uncharacterized protein YegP (UPF0339 family)